VVAAEAEAMAAAAAKEALEAKAIRNPKP